jgi:uncharacterized membrane protein
MHSRSITTYAFFLLIGILVLSVDSCYYDKEALLYPKNGTDSCSGINAAFATEIHPLIQHNCATSGCHIAADAAGGTILETYDQIVAKVARIDQRCIVEKSMPPGAPLTGTEISALKCWIEAGAPNN